MSQGPKLIDFGMGCGSIAYRIKVEARPEKKKTIAANVNVIEAAVDGSPAHYEATFILNGKFESANGVSFSNVFHLTCIVPEENDLAQYRAVEDHAARQLAPMLRALADKIEADLPTFFEEEAKPGAGEPS